MTRYRRRRAGPGGARLVEDAFDLFLDALANTLGVVMFIALMVVIFASPGPPMEVEPAQEPSDAPRVRALIERMEDLQRELDGLPPAGDPELVARYTELLREMQAAREQIARTVEAIAEASDAVRELRRETVALRTEEQTIQAQLAEVERRIAALASSSSFVRVSRFRDDPREAVLLLVSSGGVERALPTPGTASIVPGKRPRIPIASVDDARVAIDRLLQGVTPARQRIEVGVWGDSFPAFKALERALVERGFDLNPIPLAVGEPLKAGVGGIQ